MTSSQRKYIAKLYNEMYDPLLPVIIYQHMVPISALSEAMTSKFGGMLLEQEAWQILEL